MGRNELPSRSIPTNNGEKKRNSDAIKIKEATKKDVSEKKKRKKGQRRQ